MKGGIKMNTNIFIKYDFPQKSQKFRKSLIELRGQQCECCKNTTWLNQPINIEVHHIDGDKSNNQLENLQLLCPNCHSYTDNYGSKNKKQSDITDDELIIALQNSSSIRQALLSLGMSDAGGNYTRARQLIKDNNIHLAEKTLKEKENFCIDCGKVIYPGSLRCVQCNGIKNKTYIISREELKSLIRTKPFTQIGKQFNVSDNTIRKWCDNYNLPRKSNEIKTYSDKEWELI